jgi:hypothetical protein
MCNPSDFSSKSFYMRLLAFQHVLRNKHRKGAVPDPKALDLLVEPLLYFLPNKE